MKHEKWITLPIGFLLAFLLSISSAFCVITGFEFTDVNTGTVLLWCGLCSAVFCLCYTLKLPLIGFALLSLVAGFCWQQGSLLDSVQGLIHRLSRIYSMGYGWPVFVGNLEMPLYEDVTVGLCTLVTFSAVFASRAVCGGKRSVLAILFSLLPLGTCLVVTDRVPNPIWLFVLLLGITLLVLTQTLRRKSGLQAVRLTSMALIPAALLLGILFLSYPKEDYKNQNLGQQMMEDVKDWFAHLTGVADPGGPVRADGGAVDLTEVGKRTESLRKIMTVTAETNGQLYLRSCAYDTYYKNNWTNLAVECELEWPMDSLLGNRGQVTIKTNSTLDMIVFPYYPEAGTLDNVTRGISNYSGKKEYSFTWRALPKVYMNWEDLDARLPDDLTQLPTSTYLWTQQILPDILEDSNAVYSKAQAIESFVKNSAQYSLNTGRMPSEASDFAQWFIEESDTGYCVHFATAATVLLRGAGIPARYVTGYLVNVKANEETTVYGKNAHAWVEYYLPGVGWVMMEPTPSAPLQEQISDVQDSTDEPQDETLPEVTSPQQQEQQEQPPEKTKRSLWPLWTVLAVLLIAALIWLQWRLRVKLRKHKRYQGDINQRLLSTWAQLTQLWTLLETKPHPELYALAEKAKFSDHPMTRRDLMQLTLALNEATAQLKQLPIHKRLYYTLILAIY